MDIVGLLKPASSNLAGLGTTLVINSGLSLALTKLAPKWFEYDDSMTDKEKRIVGLKMIGAGLGIALIAGMAGVVVQSAVENVWNDNSESNPPDQVIG